MGRLIDGVWHRDGVIPSSKDGRFHRADSTFRDWVSADGSSGFEAESGRYVLYVSLACPWAHRTLVLRRLKRLERVIDVVVVEPHMGEEGWSFGPDHPDPLYGSSRLHQLYTRADPHYTGKVTVPVLWDRKRETIVNNESSELLRMLNSAFDDFGDASRDYYPEDLRETIDALNAEIYDKVNNGVYRTGFATRQDAYEEACNTLFETLAWLEQRLGRQRYLCGPRLTEADWRLFTTLVRFDPVYHYHFKCNRQRLSDHPALWNYTRELYQMPGIADTVDFDHIKTHYYTSHPQVNPNRIVPLGPELDFAAPHDRDRLEAA
ncbi:MAG: glutathione S-transferase family protein [Candidatus Competibacterales bacterium]|nr:glutathione S-transferase family protein [Candidatus Competibacterales bacterium]